MRTKKSTTFVTYKGKRMSLNDASDISGIGYCVLKYRLKNKLPLFKKSETKSKSKNGKLFIKVDGKKVNLHELSKSTTIPYSTLLYRFKHNRKNLLNEEDLSVNKKLNVVFNGKKMNLHEASKASGITHASLQYRLKHKFENIFDENKHNSGGTKPKFFVKYKGKKMSVIEAAAKSGVNYETLRYRIENNKKDLFKVFQKSVFYKGEYHSLKTVSKKIGITHDALRQRLLKKDVHPFRKKGIHDRKSNS